MSMPPPPPPSGGYDPPPWGGAPPPPGYTGGGQYGHTREHPQGTTILVLGILSLVVCGLLGPFAWAMGTKAMHEMDASPGVWSNRGNVTAGRICGIISSCLLIAGVAFLIVFVAAASTSLTR
jgi:hypothetical protein